MKRRVRIIFANCPHLDIGACSYLVLAQNAVQDVFEFEVYHPGVYASKAASVSLMASALLFWAGLSLPLPFRVTAGRRYTAHLDRLAIPPLSKKLKAGESHQHIRPFLQKHDRWLEGFAPGEYGNWSIESAPTVIITESSLGKYYFGWCEGEDLAIASVRNWRRKYTPPSVLEYMLAQVQRYAIRVTLCPEGESHYPTRACLWDFDPNVTDARMSLLVGYICEACEVRLKEHLSGQEFEQVRNLLSHRWIGRVDDPGSVACNLKRIFKYDLTRTRGMAPSMSDQIRAAGVPELIRLLGAGLLGFLSPRVFQWTKELISAGQHWLKW